MGKFLIVVDMQNDFIDMALGTPEAVAIVPAVKAKIESKKEESGWEFLFIAANIDAVETAARYGINKDRAVNYVPLFKALFFFILRIA